MIKLLTIKSEYESAKRLGFKTILSSNEAANSDTVIRWGNSSFFGGTQDGEFKQVVNRRRVIALNCQKDRSLEFMSKVVDTPKRYLDMIPDGVQAVVRPFEHSAGNEFMVRSGPYAIPDGYYATEYIKTENEYRVWFVANKMFHAKRVALTEQDVKDFPCRSNWGYSYRKEVPIKLGIATLQAAKVLGLEVGAADVLFKNNKYYFLELNSAPSIDTNTLIRFFKENLKTYLSDKFDIPYEKAN